MQHVRTCICIQFHNVEYIKSVADVLLSADVPVLAYYCLL